MNTKALRLQMGLSQAKFAALLGVAQFTVRRWELGICKPSPLSLEKLKGVVSGIIDNYAKGRCKK